MGEPTISFTICDIFSSTPFKGNPLAVIDTGHHALTTTQMRLLTRQFNLSETTFLLPPSEDFQDATYHLRSFLPDGREVFGAGHNILGAWWYAAFSGSIDFSNPVSVDKITGIKVFEFSQELGHRLLPVKVINNNGRDFKVSIRQSPPKLHGFHPNPTDLAHSIGLDATDIGHAGLQLRPQVLSTSTTHHLFVPIASVEALNRVSIDRETLLRQIKLAHPDAYGLYLFTPAPTESEDGVRTFQARFFSPGMSGEDPATGSAAGPLSAYLLKHGGLQLVDGVGKIRVLQGLKVGRRCVIDVQISRGSEEGGDLEVDFVGGGVVIAKGDIVIPGDDVEF